MRLRQYPKTPLACKITRPRGPGLVILLKGFNIPLICLGPQEVVWLGWCVNVRAGCFSIPRSKRLKLHLHVQKLLADPKNVHKRDLHKVAGLIQWVLGAFPLLRPWVGVLYKDIHCPPATNHSLDPYYFKEVFDCIDEDMRFIRSPTGTAIPVGAKLLEVRHLPIRQKKDLLKVVLSCKRVWLRVADPAQVKRKLSANSIAFLQFWLHWCTLPTLLRPLQFPARTTMVAAADAMGSGTKFAIGGFVKLSTATIWFSERWRPAASRSNQRV